MEALNRASKITVCRAAPSSCWRRPRPLSSGLFSLCGAGAARNRFLAAAVRASFLCLGDFLNPSPSWNAGRVMRWGILGLALEESGHRSPVRARRYQHGHWLMLVGRYQLMQGQL